MRVRLLWRIVSFAVMVTLVPLVLSGYVIQKFIQQELETEASQTLQLHLKKAAADIDAYIQTNVEVLRTLAATPDIAGMNPESQVQGLMAVAQLHNQFALLHTIDVKSGKNVARSDGGELANYSDREYFKDVENGSEQGFQTIVSKTTGKPSLAVSVPIRQGGTVVGVLAATLDLEKVSQSVGNIQIEETGYAWLVDKEYRVMAHPDQEKVQQRADMAGHPVVQQAASGSAGPLLIAIDGRRTLAMHQVLPQGWLLVVQIDESEVMARVARFNVRFTIAGLVTVALLVIGAFFQARSISRPVLQIARLAKQIAGGNLAVEALRTDRRDELGDMAVAVNQMVAGLRELVHRVTISSQTVARSAQELTGTADQVAHAAEEIQQVAAQVSDGAMEQSRSVEETTRVVHHVRAATEQIAAAAQVQAAGAHQAASIVADMVTSIEDVARTAERVSASSQQATEEARRGSQVVTQTIDGMGRIRESVQLSAHRIGELSQASAKIGAVTAAITEIADQTNLLALNAAIEAARAGEAGRGFAVVAQEVRNLAERARRSAEEISNLLQNVQDSIGQVVETMGQVTKEVESGTRLAADAGGGLQSILTVVEQTMEDVRDITRSAKELASSSQKVMDSVRSVAAITETNTTATQEMMTASEQGSTSVSEILAVSEENAASAESVTQLVGGMNRSMQVMVTLARKLAEVSTDMEKQVAGFQLGSAVPDGQRPDLASPATNRTENPRGRRAIW